MIFLLVLTLGVPLLWILYPIAIQYERGGWWNICLIVALPAWVLDVILNHTTLALLTYSFPMKRLDKYEWTFSDRLARLQYGNLWKHRIARYLKRVLDPIAPSGLHIVPIERSTFHSEKDIT